MTFFRILPAYRVTLQFVLFVTVGCVLIHAINVAFNYALIDYGILPRHPFYLLGIVRFPFIHGSWSHVFSNLWQFALLLSLVTFIHPFSCRQFYYRRLGVVLLSIWVFCGLGVWAMARTSFHIGLSGINYGLLNYLLIYSALRGGRWTLLALVGVWWWWPMLRNGLIPSYHMSFESHWCGFVIGGLLGGLFSHYDRVSPKKHKDSD